MTIQIKKDFQADIDQHFTLEWSEKPTKEQVADFNKLIKRWYEKGFASKSTMDIFII